jgi:hypothetical protein
VFFALLPVLPVIAYYKDFDLHVVITCLVICFFAGILLKSLSITFMLLGAFGCLILVEPSRHNSESAGQVLAWALLGFALGLAIELSTIGERPNRRINWLRVAELFFVIILIYGCLGLCLMPGVRT